MSQDISLHQQEIERYPVKQYFGIDGASPEYNDDCDFISGWAQQKGIKNPEDLRVELKKIEHRLGAPNLSESQIKRFVSYLRSDAKLTAALKEVSSHERGWEGII